MNEAEAVDWVIENFPEGVENYKNFPDSWFGYLFGQVMKHGRTNGRLDAELVSKELRRRLDEK